MDVLWNNGPVSIRETITHLPSEPAYTTIATVLTNLGRKGLVTVSRKNHSTLFDARMTRSEYAAKQIEQVLQASQDRAASILQLVDSMSETDLDLLRSYLRDRGREQGP